MYRPNILEYKKHENALPEITDLVEKTALELGIEYIGDHKLKDLSSALQKAKRKNGMESVFDIIRYTYILPEEDYVQKLLDVENILIARGADIVALKNFWHLYLRRQYDAVHLLCKKDDIRFEIQCHTADSYQQKQNTHTYYKLIGNPKDAGKAFRDYQLPERPYMAKQIRSYDFRSHRA